MSPDKDARIDLDRIEKNAAGMRYSHPHLNLPNNVFAMTAWIRKAQPYFEKELTELRKSERRWKNMKDSAPKESVLLEIRSQIVFAESLLAALAGTEGK